AARVLADVAASRNPAAKLDAAKQLLAKTGAGGATDREQVASHLRAMASLLRDLALIGAKADPATLANREVSVSLERLTTSYSSRRAVDAYAVVDKALTALDRNAGVKVVADWVVLHV
ncbi:MAG TPA: hypothetical protein VFA59_22110, partial [Vicinamibacterales bacterium]|nr:hypothetical protein [Vicinamibacterales bacterium]